MLECKLFELARSTMLEDLKNIVTDSGTGLSLPESKAKLLKLLLKGSDDAYDKETNWLIMQIVQSYIMVTKRFDKPSSPQGRN